MRITLEISAGPETGRKLWLGAGQSLVIGRTQLAEFSVPDDAQMSSVHFQIAWQGPGFLLRDLKSTNGTTLNGERIHEVVLHSGDVILAGGSKFTVLLETDDPTSVNSQSSTATLPGSSIGGALASGTVDKLVGLRIEPNQRESHTLPVASNVQGTLVFDTSVRGVPEVEPHLEEDEPSELLVVDNRTPFSVICLPWQNADGAGRLTVVVKATFRFSDSEASLADVQLPIWFADQHEEDDPLRPVRYEADTAPFKPRADVVLVGKAYAPGGRPRAMVDVQLRVGGLNKRLRVFGDRRWLFPTRLAVVPQITDATSFTEMPLTYTRAFGGIDQPAAKYCAENLAGVGFIGEPSPTSIHDKPLPNIEDPDHLIGSWDARPQPVGFGFYGRGWQPRLKYLGTYDAAYRRNRSPLWPEDFSYDFHNGAHPDLQVAGYLEGDELVELENLTRDGYAKFPLPGIRPLITLTRYVSAPTKVRGDSGIDSRIKKAERPVKPFFDSLVFTPDQRLVYAVFRAVFAVQDIENPAIAEIRVESA